MMMGYVNGISQPGAIIGTRTGWAARLSSKISICWISAENSWLQFYKYFLNIDAATATEIPNRAANGNTTKFGWTDTGKAK